MYSLTEYLQMSRAFVFPGQGSQFVGMGKDLAEAFAEARAVFDEVDEALGQKLLHLMSDGPEAALNLTENTQPALMAVSMAVSRVLQARGLDLSQHAACVAGHSLGEYSALTAAGAFTLADAARLLRIRGQAMQAAVPVGQGAMAALLGLELDAVRAVAAEAAQGEVCEAANDNAPGQVVVSGHRDAVERAVALAKAQGAKRALILPVSAPFHCALMAPAAARMAEALAETAIQAPIVPVYANVLAAPVSDPAQIRILLVQQVTGAVRWRESVSAMAAAGVSEMIELGAGKVLSGLIRRIEKDVTTASAGLAADMDAIAARVVG
jgi:[acyl-carrier-protein] S-malonyltransferase